MPEQRSDFAFVEVAGKRFNVSTSYALDSDMFTPADGFRLGIGLPGIRTADDRRAREQLRADLSPGNTVKVSIGTDAAGTDSTRHLQMTGIIDDLTVSATREDGSEFEIEGRDLACHLVDSSAPLDPLDFSRVTQHRRLYPYDLEYGEYAVYIVPGPVEETYTTKEPVPFSELAAAVCSLWGIPVVAGSNSSRDVLTGRPRGARRATDTRRAGKAGAYAADQSPDEVKRVSVDEARPQVGETAWAYLERHAKRLGVMMWMSPSGYLILGSPQYEQESRGRIVRRLRSDPRDPDNATGAVKTSIGDRYSQVTVYGHSGRNVSRSKVVGTALDADWPASFPKPLVLQDRSIKTADEAQRRAERELARHKASALTLTYTVEGHGVWIGGQRYLWATDTMVDVIDEVAGIEGRFYVTKRTFSCDRSGGTTTTLQLVPPGSIVL